MAEAVSARALFAPLGPTYDRYAALLSFGQDPRWRRFLVSRVAAGPGDTVLDVATGTGAVARELIRRKRCTVVGLDQSPEMLAEARGRLGPEVKLVEGKVIELPKVASVAGGRTPNPSGSHANGASRSMPFTSTTRGAPATTVPAKERLPFSVVTVMRIRLS